jgi:CheY-like chemotaxis protein
MSILVIDDDPISLKLAAAVLGKHNYTVTARTSGREALEFIASGEPVELVISDIMMPEMDGFALLNKLRAAPSLRDVPVILCTSLNDNTSVATGIKLGVADYITKPINPETLLSKVQRALHNRQAAVLIASDQQVPRELLARTISRGGYPIIAAGSGAEALRLLAEHRVGVILAETTMSPMNGLELLTTVRKQFPSVPLVLMADRNCHEKEDVLKAGADGYLAKPLNNTEIMNLVKRFLN